MVRRLIRHFIIELSSKGFTITINILKKWWVTSNQLIKDLDLGLVQLDLKMII